MITEEVKPKIAVGIVTYGDRWKLLDKVLQRLVEDPYVGTILVVDNGSQIPTASEISKRGWADRVTVSRNSENKGSASGYAQALRLLETEAREPLYYLLDDDNRPETDAISILADTWLNFESKIDVCCLSLRNDRPEQKAALLNATPLRHRKNSFAGFHVANAFRRFLKRNMASKNKLISQIDVEYAPYGGLLLHRSWLTRIGLPKEEYFLYADDHEFTSRIVRSGGRIVLLADSRVEDLETSWHLKPVAARAGIFSASGPDFRLYYSIRNRVNFERYSLVDSLPVYGFNILSNLCIRFLRAAIAERNIVQPLRKMRIAIRAISDGWFGRLGRIEEF